ncbi:3-hydroxyacyl-CoA dehydrogenase family protein [Pontibacter anaerobius]|uniref:3-hydroxyacyl-CoA dehydrogenase family protein n=1 Tax=Pontibacter anaerobius TaxID=2993940 RepID=A0ABT3RF88_9BACT|nr:3-hydroxyacyl-CoA dehydrogenase family protein [Pontibacter anaerobius]MCX2740504.1 3-hydroxyacyl-CoA dehydrogenase family protein [Pontibacter anaerobius]
MHIVVLSGPEMATEFKQKFQEERDGISYTFLQSHSPADEQLKPSDVVFDFLLHEQPERLSLYAPGQVVFCNAPTLQLAALAKESGLEHPCALIGFNGLPTLFNRPVLEVSLLDKSCEEKLQEVCQALGTEYLLVEDRVGMVTPRIICMIINEACYTLQEKTAGISDLDLGMKLGTNYPKGPFEWANQIGVQHVYRVLQAVYEDTRDERYKICPLLKTKYLKGESF